MTVQSVQGDHIIAARYAPVMMLDRAEPYLPFALGYSVFRSAGASPSSKYAIEPASALTIEYAIYYDWDIGHLYDLEHVWVHLDAAGAIVRVEASAHGRRVVMDAGAGGVEVRDGRPTVYVEAGKHAHWAAPEQMQLVDRQRLIAMCEPLAGIEGVHLGNAFAQPGRYDASPHEHRLARLKMQRDGFVPTFEYEPLSAGIVLMPWSDLEAAIPGRIRAALDGLQGGKAHLGAILLDCGDTLVDERTEVKEPGSDVVLRGALIPGARDMLHALKAAGHTLVLVADGPRQTFFNVLRQHGLWEMFDAHIISEDVGALKPDARMFDAALSSVALDRGDAWRCVMIGNNLARDIKGAKALGIPSVFMAWSTLRSHVPADASEEPDYKIEAPEQFPRLVQQIEALLPFRMPSCGAA